MQFMKIIMKIYTLFIIVIKKLSKFEKSIFINSKSYKTAIRTTNTHYEKTLILFVSTAIAVHAAILYTLEPKMYRSISRKLIRSIFIESTLLTRRNKGLQSTRHAPRSPHSARVSLHFFRDPLLK